MNDRRKFFAVCSSLCFAACAEPSLSFDVQIPAALKPLVETTELHVYVPPAAGGFGCEQLELGLVDADARALNEAQAIRLVGREEAPIRDIDRLSRNIFYVELRGEGGSAVAFACAETAEFSDDVSISVAAEPAVRLELPQNIELSRYSGEGLPPRIPVRALDVLGQPVPDALISWTVAGKDGPREFAPSKTDAQGMSEIDADLPTRVGPFVLVVRGSWVIGGPVEVRGLVSPRPKAARLPGIPLGAELGRFQEGHDSVALLFGFGGDRRIELFDAQSFPSGDGQLTPRVSIPLPDGATLAALNYPGDELDRLVFLTTPGLSLVFTRINPDGTVVEKTTTRPLGATSIRRVLNSGACRPPGRPALTIIYEGDVDAEYDEQGNLLSERRGSKEELDYTASGCLGDESGTVRRVGVRMSSFRTAILDVAGTETTVSWLDQPTLLNFSPAIGGPEILLANILQPGARAIVQGRLNSDATEIVAFASDPVSDVPVVTAGLDVDGDQRLDFASVVTNDDPTTGVRNYRLRISSAAEYLGRRISGTIGIDEPLCYLTMLTGDFDGDGADDVLVSEVSPLACGSLALSRVYLVPMGG